MCTSFGGFGSYYEREKMETQNARSLHWSGCLGNLAGVALFVFVSIFSLILTSFLLILAAFLQIVSAVNISSCFDFLPETVNQLQSKVGAPLWTKQPNSSGPNDQKMLTTTPIWKQNRNGAHFCKLYKIPSRHQN